MQIITISTLILGSIIGAGFASGQEIKIFFSNFGIYGLIGMIVSIFFMTLVVNLTLKIILKYNITTYDELAEIIFKNNNIVKDITKNIVYVFLLVTFFIMIIGFSTCLEEQFGISRLIGGIIATAICYFALIGDIERVLKINKYIMPLLVMLIFAAGVVTFFIGDIEIREHYNSNHLFIISAIIYSSYNIIPILPILPTIKNKLVGKKQINLVSGFLFLLISIPAVSIYIITSSNHLENSEIILLEVISPWGGFGYVVFSLVILLAIYTSAICSGYSFAKGISKETYTYKKIIMALCIFATLVSGFSFSTSIKILYPVFGTLGLLQIACLIMVDKKNRT